MKRFLSNLILAVLAFAGFVAMAGTPDVEMPVCLHLIIFLAGFVVCGWATAKLGSRLASHLPDEEV